MRYADLPIESEAAQAFLNEYFPHDQLYSFPRYGGMEVGQCYSNVRQVVASQGGSVQYGWIFGWIPGHLIEALHHSVWRRPGGAPQDVTKGAFDGSDTGTAVFIEDHSTPVTPYDPAVVSKFKQLDDCEGTRHYIEITTERVKLVAQQSVLMQMLPHTPRPEGIALHVYPPQNLQILMDQAEALRKLRDDYLARFAIGNFNRMD